MGPQLADLIATGDVKLEMVHFPLRTESIWAVEAVECAGEQGFWWAMHSRILENQKRGVSTKLMKEYAAEMGLDTKAFNQCMDSDKYVKYAKEQGEAAAKKGVNGTPTFMLNGQFLQLKQSFNEVAEAVKKELSKQ